MSISKIKLRNIDWLAVAKVVFKIGKRIYEWINEDRIAKRPEMIKDLMSFKLDKWGDLK